MITPSAFEIEPENEKVTGRCECCGNVSRAVWGFAYLYGRPFAAYQVHWTMGHVPEYGANFDLIVGRWAADGGTSADRSAVSLVYRIVDNGPAFTVIDANARNIAKSNLASRALKRDEIVGQPIAHDVFALCDAVLMQDERVAEILGGRTLQQRE